MVLPLVILTWLLIFIATRKSISFNKRRYWYISAIVVSTIALVISITNLINTVN